LNPKLLIFLIALFSVIGKAAQAPFDEAQVFEWWDDGIITSEEADEIFSRLEEENYDEACLLAEVYAQEPCDTPSPEPPKPKRKKKRAKQTKSAPTVPSIVPHGRFSWKGQYDSDGHLKKQYSELHIKFYYFKFRHGSQELLSYRRDGLEAHFGQISTIELYSHLPLDTLWGTALLYPIGNLRLAALLDTSKTFHAQAHYRINRYNEIATSFWKFPDAGAISFQARTTLGQVSAWYQFGQDAPLVKLQLQSEKKRLSWKTTAYLHGDSIPQGLNLSKGIAKNWLWASQTVNVHWPEAQNAVFSAKARVLSPTGTDSISARFKTSIAAGPKHLRPSFSATCIEASENCAKTDWKTALESEWEKFMFKASIQFRHDHRVKPPKIELGAGYFESSRTFVKVTVALPDANPGKSITVQNEIRLDSDFIGCNFVFAFKKNRTRSFKPNYAHLNASLNF